MWDPQSQPYKPPRPVKWIPLRFTSHVFVNITACHKVWPHFILPDIFTNRNVTATYDVIVAYLAFFRYLTLEC
jgi:hypothetical protein